MPRLVFDSGGPAHPVLLLQHRAVVPTADASSPGLVGAGC